MRLKITDGRIGEYLQYHNISDEIKDIDPSYLMLKYVADRFELNIEQRYWLAFLYSITYNASTVFYIYNEFPDYAGVNIVRMQNWWRENKHLLDFQTDCRWIKSRNQFVEIVEHYLLLCGKNQNDAYIKCVNGLSAIEGYKQCFEYFGRLPWFGRFRLFLLLEAVCVVAGLSIEPDGLPLKTAESSRNGLCFALGQDDLLTGHDYKRKTLRPDELDFLSEQYQQLISLMKAKMPSKRIDAWNVETTLCAYKKWHRGKRFPGYYITRQGMEIHAMSQKIKDGVCWRVLWDFRNETYPRTILWEHTGRKDNLSWSKNKSQCCDKKGIRGVLWG